MTEIETFINTHFNEIQKKDRKINTPKQAVGILLQSSIFDIKTNPKIFDWKRYISTYPDLQSNLKTPKDAAWHYLLYGIRERRKSYVLNSNEMYEHQFNWKDYITINQDLKYLMTDVDAFRHYITEGYSQNRQTTIKEQVILNDRIEITENPSINEQWLKLVYSNLSKLKDLIGKSISNSEINTIKNFQCINIENNKSYDELTSNSNGDCINETNFINNILDNNITLYYNNVFMSGNKDLIPEVTISRNKDYNKIINKNNVFLSPIPYKERAFGLYFITRSMIEAIQNKKSILYPYVFKNHLYNQINSKPFFLQEQSVNKNWYDWKTDEEVKQLKLQYFSEDAFVICICGRIAINSYPKSILEAIKLLRNQGHNIHLLALTKFEVNPHRLTQELYNEITSYDWVKSFTVEKKEILNYFRFCDVLASTYRDFCNHVGGSNKIKEYLLCNKPILCSRGRERERELGKDYIGLYDCETCSTVPPLCWTEEYINNSKCYIKQYNKYFKNSDLNGGVKSEINFSVGFIKQNIKKKCIVAVIPVFGREPLLKYTIRRAYDKNRVNYVIVLGESESEEETAKKEGAIFIKHKNRPLGKKWNAGFIYAKRFNPDALLFIGSSDWISSDWMDRAYTEILNGAGYVGKSDFDMVDIKGDVRRFCKWYGYVCKRKNETIGIGRLVSRKLLDAINFSPFPDNKDNSMDYGMYLHCINHKMPIKILTNDSIFLSISCDLWKNMHQFDLHYNSCLPECEKIYARDQSGCKNKRRNNMNGFRCDVHQKDCKLDIDDFQENKSLYKNGRIYNQDDCDKLLKEFPELNEFYIDYLTIKNTNNKNN